MRLSLVVLLLQGCCWLSVARASAPESDARAALEHGVELSLEAEFEQALSVFDGLLAQGALSPDERKRLLSERSLVLFALGEEQELAKNLRALAEIAPDTRLSERAPPALLARWQTVAAGAREAQAAAARERVTPPAAIVLAAPPQRVDGDGERGMSLRTRRGLWIGGAAAVAAAALVTALVLSMPSDSSGRTAVKPSVEF
jgi:hypothetical protein